MTVKRLNEIAERVHDIEINYQIHFEMDVVEKTKYVDELLEFSDELLKVLDSYKYFWIMQTLLHDISRVTSELLK